MNERIKELLYQSGALYNGHNVLTGDERLDTELVDCETFAELIVKKCAMYAEEYTNDSRIYDHITYQFGIE